MSVNDFKNVILSRTLDILWRQWSALGVFGSAPVWEKTVIDPEALILATCYFGRYEARLFDTMLEWLLMQNSCINVQRLKGVSITGLFSGKPLLSAIADMMPTPGQRLKWSACAVPRQHTKDLERQPLFFLQSGQPLPVVGQLDDCFKAHGYLRNPFSVRGVTGKFDSQNKACLLLKLRALIGVSARADILAYLMCHTSGSPRSMARFLMFYPATIAKALVEMEESGCISHVGDGLKKMYTLTEPILNCSADKHEVLPMPNWIILFNALERLHLFCNSSERSNESALEQASGLRHLLDDEHVLSQLQQSGIRLRSRALQNYRGEAILTETQQLVDDLFKEL